MSQENVETIARLYDEFFAHPERVSDPGLFQFFDPAVEIRQSASFFPTGRRSLVLLLRVRVHVVTSSPTSA
jgi:hypothetical protein